MQGRDGKIGLFLLLVSLFLCYGAIRLGLGQTHDPGPGFFPFLAGAIIGALSIILIVTSSRPGGRGSAPSGPLVTGRAALTLGLFTLSGFFVERVGFFICSFLMTLTMLWLNGVKNPPFLLAVAVITSLGIYLVFNVLLDVRLPVGILRWGGN